VISTFRGLGATLIYDLDSLFFFWLLPEVSAATIEVSWLPRDGPFSSGTWRSISFSEV